MLDVSFINMVLVDFLDVVVVELSSVRYHLVDVLLVVCFISVRVFSRDFGVSASPAGLDLKA